MQIYKGKTVNKKCAIGKLYVYDPKEKIVEKKAIGTVEDETYNLNLAKQKASEDYQKLYEKALKESGEDVAQLFLVYQMLIESGEFNTSITSFINSGYSAKYAVEETGKKYYQMFANMDDEYMKERGNDILAIANKISECLDKNHECYTQLQEPVILIAYELMPEDIMRFDKEKILGMITVKGSLNSHTAILARMRDIPAILGVNINIEEIKKDDIAIINGKNEEILINPTLNIQKEFYDNYKTFSQEEYLLQKGKETITKDGRKVHLYANISSVADMEEVLKNDAEGIGLFRTEFLYMGRDSAPSEEEQFQIYSRILKNMKDKPVIIRSFDIGADKKLSYIESQLENNPAMGCRGVRVYPLVREMFITQMRALFRASVFGNLKVMYPMVSSIEEVIEIKKITEALRQELSQSGIPWKEISEGIMIETPAAALISDELIQEVDFFSIGSNDLTQYTLAIDRENQVLDTYYDPYHKGVLKLIQMTIKNAHEAGKWVGICGELGADIDFTERLVKMGIDEISTPPAMILKLRKIIREMNLE